MGSSNVKKNMVLALCKHLSVDPSPFASDLGSDFRSLCTSILKKSSNADALVKNNELMKWIEFADSFLSSNAAVKGLNELNEELITKSVLLGNGLKLSAADIIVFSAVHSYVIGLSGADRAKYPHLLRWADYIQNKEEIGNAFEKILLEKVQFAPPALKPAKKVEDSKPNKTVQEAKPADSSETDSKAKKSADPQKKKVEGVTQTTAEKKKQPEKEVDKKDEELSVSLLKIQIGHIRKAWKHPSADSLLVEEIDVGEAKCRQVVSGLAKYCTPEELTNRRVVLITNVKPGKLRDVMSEGLVLCASNQDHTVVEPLRAPEGAKLGECITFSGHNGKPEDVLNPKKKQLDKITPHLFTDDKGVATFKGIPFMTSSGPCTSSIPNASIK
ncbi:aminoacyl tRNA synthase complex-interacting multifunctional protein 1 [Sesamum indicum]|uniref:Aminoacyl tRNA synthase complex-interacting multifunctional protein 1 n=1 Tax=Sesamum indicum TaxID=4182 RepID=A0A6I9TU68_SESIN|nr:aminoacyl tRNA synthase complex-interacting multifunctional protein 1 [Sesamum indicum]